MQKQLKIFGVQLLTLISLIILSACGNRNATPTLDAAAVYTQAVQTVQAGLTETAISLPTNTPTETELPTFTPEPTLEATYTLIPTSTNSVPPTLPSESNGDKGEWLSQSPGDGTTIYANQAFTTTWVVKNIGTTTWNKNYQLRFYLSDPVLRFGGVDIKFPRDVKPGDTVDLSVAMTAPSTAGDYTTVWVLTNDQGVNFYFVTLNIKVPGVAPTATHTIAPTLTETFASTP